MTHVTPQFLKEQGFNISFPARFFAKIEYTESCWLWMAWKLPKGYGLIGRGGRGKGMELAHRASWILHFGAIPDGLDVCHNCPERDNPSCVNPAHLFVGTRSDNMRDYCNKGGKLGGAKHPMYGRENGSCKLTNEQVEEIRKLYIPGYGHQIQLAKRFGVHHCTIDGIVNGKARLKTRG